MDSLENIKKEFPYVVELEGCWWDFDKLNIFLWDYFGPSEGSCEGTMFLEEIWYCPESKLTNFDFFRADDYYDKCEEVLGEDAKTTANIEFSLHHHEGTWKWGGCWKTGYDYGLIYYVFKTKELLNQFHTILIASGVSIG